MKKFLNLFSTYELILIALLAALGIATKPIIVPLIHMITGPLFIPGGAVAGGFYMLWIVLGGALIPKRGTTTMIALVQAIVVLSSGVFGTHGIVSIITYTLPGIAIDISWIIFNRCNMLIKCFIGGIIANICGTYLSNLIFFRLPIVPLILSLASAALSGGVGGIIAYNIYNSINKIKKYE